MNRYSLVGLPTVSAAVLVNVSAGVDVLQLYGKSVLSKTKHETAASTTTPFNKAYFVPETQHVQ